MVSPGISSTSSISIITTRLQLISSEAPILSLNLPLYAKPEGLKKILLEIEKKEFDGLVLYNDGLQSLPRCQDVMGVVNRIRF